MATIIECDGCRTRLGGGDIGMEGSRVFERGSKAPFHWCKDCAEIARAAVKASRPQGPKLVTC